MTDSLSEFSKDPQPKNWLVESILVTLLCCLPLGIVGIIFASQVNSKFAAGDIEGAKIASQQAGQFTKIGFFLGLAGLVIYMILIFAFGLTAFWNAKG